MMKKRMGRPPKVKPQVEDIVLPEGVCVVERSHELEMVMNTRNRWLPYAKKIATLTGVQTLQLEIGNLKDMPNAKAKINSIKGGIKFAWKMLGYKQPLRFGVNGSKLYVWANM